MKRNVVAFASFAVALGFGFSANAQPLQTLSGDIASVDNAALLMAGDLAAARQAATEAWPLAWQTGAAHYFLDHVALYAVRTGREAQAAQLIGFASRIYATGREPRQPNEARSVEQAEAAAASILGAGGYDRMRAAGEALSDEQAQAITRAVLAERHAP